MSSMGRIWQTVMLLFKCEWRKWLKRRAREKNVEKEKARQRERVCERKNVRGSEKSQLFMWRT